MTGQTPTLSLVTRLQTSAPPEHDARTLTGGGTRATITLDGKAYILTITKAGKLILTK